MQEVEMSTIPITLAGSSELRVKQSAPDQDRQDRQNSQNPQVMPRRPARLDFTEKREPVPEKREPAANFESVAELHSFLEHRSRQWSMTIRLLEQQRQYLRGVEVQREDGYKKLAEIMETVVDTARSLKSATEKDGRSAAEVEIICEKNRKALDQLENIAVSLSTNFVCWRSAWEQYVQTVDKAKTLRAEMVASESLAEV
jgi:hypothetical protein